MSKKFLNVEKKEFDFDLITSHLKQIFTKRDFSLKAFRYQINIALDQFTIDFCKGNIGKLQEKNIKFYVPNTWKDHFKKKHKYKRWMKWYIKKHPVVLKEIKFKLTKTTVFPEVEVPESVKEFLNHFTFFEAKVIYKIEVAHES